MTAIKLIVGLGNPGAEYEQTRHNAGALFVERIANAQGVNLVADRKYFGLTGRYSHQGQDVRLLIPTTYMNRSGQAVAALAGFFRITPEEILVAHDELDLPPGVAKLKQGGGHGGHVRGSSLELVGYSARGTVTRSTPACEWITRQRLQLLEQRVARERWQQLCHHRGPERRTLRLSELSGPTGG